MSSDVVAAVPVTSVTSSGRARGGLSRPVIALIAFLTLVDLFATQAILPVLAHAYQVTPSAMGFAVNASAMGMAIASLAIAFLSHRINRTLYRRLLIRFLQTWLWLVIPSTSPWL